MSITKTQKSGKAATVFEGQSTETLLARRQRSSESDFVCGALDLLVRSGLIADEDRPAADKALRSHFKGNTYYVAATEPTDSAAAARQVLAKFNGRNPREVARELGVSRATVYRRLKQPG
jgi:DNA-binding NtrC family response regulator